MSHEVLDYMRFAVSAAGLVAFGVNLTVAAFACRHRAIIGIPHPIIAYALAGAGTIAVAMYWRLQDHFADLPLNTGDFTALVPILGFLIAGLGMIRSIGRNVVQAEVGVLKAETDAVILAHKSIERARQPQGRFDAG